MNRLKRQLCAAVRASLTGSKATPPEAGRTLWNAFQRLSAGRTYHAAGPNPIQHGEIEAFCRLRALPLAPRHVEILCAMDAAWLDQVMIRQRVPQGVKVLPPVSKQPLSAALLDVVMG